MWFHEAGEMGMPGLRWTLVLGGLVVSIGWAQKANNGPLLSVEIPNGLALNSVEVAFSVNRGELYSYNTPKALNIPATGNSTFQRYVIDASVGGTAADRVRAVVFMPGCETNSLDVAIHGKSVARDVKCVQLPHWTLKGQIVDSAITKTGWLKVDVTYRANWVSKFLEVERIGVDQPPVEPAEFDVASVPVSKNKSFSAELPILMRDPGEVAAEEEDRGELLFTLRNVETKDPVIVGILRPDQFATPSGGLELRTEYPEQLRFVLRR
jgi:hypothetical protein